MAKKILWKMLMMIDDSIVDAAVEKDSLALQVLQNLATSQAMGII